MGAGNSNMRFERVMVTCPYCRGEAVVASGGYDTGPDGEIQAAVPSTEWSADIMRKAGLLVQDLLAEGLPPDAIVERVRDEVSPDVAKTLEGKSRKQLKRLARDLAVGGVIYGAGLGLNAAFDIGADRPSISQTVEPPPGSEGTITQRPDGTIVTHWRPAEPGKASEPDPP